MRHLQDDGWQVSRQRGSHKVMKHATKQGIVIVAGKPNEVPKGTLNNILRQAQLED